MESKDSKELTKALVDAYEKTNYAGLDKLYKFLKVENPTITKNQIKQFLDAQIEEQLLKQSKKAKNSGHITALSENENMQIDIYDLSKFASSNSNYKYIFAMVDVFTRKLYALPMKNKSIISTTKSLEKIMKEYDIQPRVLTSDNDSSFLGKEFQDFLAKNNIILLPNQIGDHNALGIIDNMARRLKLTFGKIFLKTDKSNWVDYLQKIVDNYNNLPNSSLLNLSPNQVMQSQETEQEIRLLNVRKSTKNRTVSDLNPGDNVRIKIKGIFTKSSEPQFSDQVYVVDKVNHRTITLTDGQIKRRHTLLKVPIGSISKTTPNVIQRANKTNKVKRKLKQSGIIETNLIETKRIKKRNKKYLN